jgi:hypothetical protein
LAYKYNVADGNYWYAATMMMAPMMRDIQQQATMVSHGVYNYINHILLAQQQSTNDATQQFDTTSNKNGA